MRTPIKKRKRRRISNLQNRFLERLILRCGRPYLAVKDVEISMEILRGWRADKDFETRYLETQKKGADYELSVVSNALLLHLANGNKSIIKLIQKLWGDDAPEKILSKSLVLRWDKEGMLILSCNG